MLKIAFRDDDLDEPIQSFQDYNQLMAKYEIPIAYAVIPSRLTKENAIFFRNLKSSYNIEFLQHGWSHTNHNVHGDKKAEFSVRDKKIEHEEIARGYKVMEELFENDFTPIFVPPYHSYNRDTWCSAEFAGCKGFSAKAGMSEYPGLKSIPANILFDIYEGDNYRFRKAGDILEEFLLLSRRVETIVFLTHHKKVSQAELFELEKILIFLRLMKNKGQLRFVSFSELLETSLEGK